MIWLVLTWLAAPFLWLRAARRRPIELRRVLVIQTAKIGDFVATTPVFRALRQQLPQAEVIALLHPVNLPLASALDSIDRIIALPPHGFKGWAGKLWLYRELADDIDAVCVLSPNLATLLVPLWAGVPVRVAVLPDRRRGSARLAWPFLTHGEPHRTGRLFRETALRALAGLGIPIDEAALNLPNEVRQTEAGKGLREASLAGYAGPFVGLGVGAGNRLKALDVCQLRELAAGILERTPATLVLIGTKEDQASAAELLAKLPSGRVIDATGRWRLDDLPALLAGLDVFVGVDSGATYLADAVGVPVVDYMGPADADDQRPLGPRAVVIRSTETCAPCSHTFDAPYRCHKNTRACIAHAPITALVAEITNLLMI